MNDNLADKQQHIVVYTVTLTITRPVDDPYDEGPPNIIQWMSSPEARRRLEKDVVKALAKFDGDCDCEVIEVNSYAD